MTDERLPLSELLEKAGEGDFVRAVFRRATRSSPHSTSGSRPRSATPTRDVFMQRQ
jgi:hypothetical protein